MIVVAITASRVDIMGKLLRSGLADRTNEEGPVLTLLGAIRTDSGNPHLRKTAWWGWEDSNLQPNEFQCAVVWMRDHCKVVAIPTARPV